MLGACGKICRMIKQTGQCIAHVFVQEQVVDTEINQSKYHKQTA